MYHLQLISVTNSWLWLQTTLVLGTSYAIAKLAPNRGCWAKAPKRQLFVFRQLKQTASVQFSISFRRQRM